MSSTFETAKVKLVTIVASFEFGDRIASDLRAFGVSGYTKTRADGWGVHGARHYGIVDGANLRFDTLVTVELAHEILRGIAANFAHEAVVAFSCDAEAIPSHHFV